MRKTKEDEEWKIEMKGDEEWKIEMRWVGEEWKLEWNGDIRMMKNKIWREKYKGCIIELRWRNERKWED